MTMQLADKPWSTEELNKISQPIHQEVGKSADYNTAL